MSTFSFALNLFLIGFNLRGAIDAGFSGRAGLLWFFLALIGASVMLALAAYGQMRTT